jgi:alpha-beta hydrolase superfamily lysophospholipase
MLSRIPDTYFWAERQLGNIWHRLEQIAFGASMGSLVAFLFLLYADVPIVGY